ncbi:sperm-associated antigen 4 protein-like isoform X1 [Grus americana]|uniref:sperm-associated antigen 4 protein-like isoform X1 n=2 Tax=Grus americana TaxID=9117 RepID=UPI002407ABA8|nr:sperm-associated antigen 4 protein-like isoform X1 [Grus americana]
MGKGEGGTPGSSPAVLPSLAAAGTARPLARASAQATPARLASRGVGTVGSRLLSFAFHRNLCMDVELLSLSSMPSAGSVSQGPAKWRDKATESTRMVFSRLCHLAGALVSLWRHMLSACVFAVQKMALRKKRFLKVVFLLLPVALAGVYRGTSWPAWTVRGKGPIEEPTRASAADLKNLGALLAEQTRKMQLLLEEVAQLRVEISSAKEVKQAASQTAWEASVEMSDWALKSSGATIDMQRTSETYHCQEHWSCRVLSFFYPAKPPDTILQPDVSQGNCWPLQGHQGQVVIRLPARVHLTGVTVQHTVGQEVFTSRTTSSAPRDMAVFGVDTDREEETLLGTFTYNIAKEAIQTFPLQNAPVPRAFSSVRLLVKSNWGKPAYTCIYRVQVHGKMAKPESLN